MLRRVCQACLKVSTEVLLVLWSLPRSNVAISYCKRDHQQEQNLRRGSRCSLKEIEQSSSCPCALPMWSDPETKWYPIHPVTKWPFFGNSSRHEAQMPLGFRHLNLQTVQLQSAVLSFDATSSRWCNTKRWLRWPSTVNHNESKQRNDVFWPLTAC